MSINFELTNAVNLRQFEERPEGLFFYNGDQLHQVLPELLDDKAVPMMGKATTVIDKTTYEMHAVVSVRVKEHDEYERDCKAYDEAKKAAVEAGHGYVKEQPTRRLDNFVFLVATTNVNTPPPHHSAYAKGEFITYDTMDVSDHFNHAFFEKWTKKWLAQALRSAVTV